MRFSSTTLAKELANNSKNQQVSNIQQGFLLYILLPLILTTLYLFVIHYQCRYVQYYKAITLKTTTQNTKQFFIKLFAQVKSANKNNAK